MEYKSPNYQHGDSRKKGVLMVNLGTPEAPTKAALKKYLRTFLSDPRVVEFQGPRWLWLLILNAVILNIRPKKSAAAYAGIWDELGRGTGSPLMHISQLQHQALRQELGDDTLVELAMRYGEPSIEAGLDKLQQQGAQSVVILPLYPQYSASTVASIFDDVSRVYQQRRWLPDIRFISHYHDHNLYIEALAQSVIAHQKQHGKQFLLMSFHGIPLRYLHNGDPYHCECHKTGRLLAERLQLREDEYQVSFQSIFGREPWLKPYTDATLKALPDKSVKQVQVICPGFAADCLETLEEIAIENRDYFINAGGETFSYIPALNDSRAHIHLLAELIKQQSQGLDIPVPQSPNKTAERFQQHPYNQKT
ncbi:ferrochelatase [Marinicella gelatinilytica]|uniref:ferrochelatase n=1 Tax=Marinicella gelatinilytica TaxID=2996017 RepID=UPI002260B4D8|nr:ferrochelatase [Marinicella gelatinilytica]MCX7544318.1 ferrochelatase [Marinicella gelatinilytica]